MTERINIFNDRHEWQGIVSRDEAHAQGLWHETFHCWLYDEEHIYFQLRSPLKKDYPSLFDITAAGHLTSDETPEDGLRELEEELGITLTIDNVTKLGVIPCEIVSPQMIDREFSHVFMAPFHKDFDAFTLQVEEVAGIAKAKLDEALPFFKGEVSTLQLTGFYEEAGERYRLERTALPQHFVGFRERYLQQVIEAIQRLCVMK